MYATDVEGEGDGERAIEYVSVSSVGQDAASATRERERREKEGRRGGRIRERSDWLMREEDDEGGEERERKALIEADWLVRRDGEGRGEEE